MDELFKKTNEFLLEFYAILKELEEKEIESLKPIADPETYGFPEVDYIFEKLLSDHKVLEVIVLDYLKLCHYL